MPKEGLASDITTVGSGLSPLPIPNFVYRKVVDIDKMACR